MNLDRFPAPNANDEKVRCVWCQNKFNYQALNGEGYCPDCAPETEEEENTMTEKEMNKRNAWIAEHVMEWRIRVTGRGSVVATADSNTNEERDYLIESNHPWDSVNWNPTTDYAAAMQVLERCAMKLSPDGGGRAIAIEWNGDVVESFSVSETDIADGISAEANDLPLAICLFAQKLFTHEKET